MFERVIFSKLQSINAMEFFIIIIFNKLQSINTINFFIVIILVLIKINKINITMRLSIQKLNQKGNNYYNYNFYLKINNIINKLFI